VFLWPYEVLLNSSLTKRIIFFYLNTELLFFKPIQKRRCEMRRSFRHYSKYAFVLFVFILAILFTQLLVNGGFPGQGVAEAKVIQEEGVFDEETVAFDKANPQIQAALAVQDRHTDILKSEPGIVGTATGLNEHGRPAIIVFAKSSELAKTIVEVLKEHTEELMSLPGVVGTAQGLCDDKPCIKVYVYKGIRYRKDT
jgi:hypothetical protein